MENAVIAEESTVTAKIKEAALNFGADVVGIAAASRWDDYVPQGYRPSDLLPDAKTVIVVGARGPTAGAWRSRRMSAAAARNGAGARRC